MAIESIEINPELPQVHICWFPGTGEWTTPDEAAIYAVPKDRRSIVRVLCMFRTRWYEVVGCKSAKQLHEERA